MRFLEQSLPERASSARLPGQVVLLGWVSFFADISSEMAYPLIPLLVVAVLGSSAATLGGIEGAAQFAVALVAAWSGWHSDRLRHRVTYVRVGYGLPILGRLMLALASSSAMVLGGRLVDRLGKGLRGSPRDALIGDVTPQEIRGKAFGFHRAMDSAGAMLGILTAAVILWWWSSSSAGNPVDQASLLRGVLLLSTALGTISFIVTFLVKEPEPSSKVTDSQARVQMASLRALPPAYWRTLALLLVFSLANSSDTFLLLRARDLGLPNWAAVLAYGFCTIFYMLLSYPAGVLSDRIGRWRVIGVGWLVYAMVYGGFAITNATGVWPLLALYGGYLALTDGVGKALVLDHVSSTQKGTALGIYYLASGLVMLLASVIAGMLWDQIGPHATFGFAAAVSAAALLLVWILPPEGIQRVGMVKSP